MRSKRFWSLMRQNFVKTNSLGLRKTSLITLNFGPFSIAWMKVNKIELIFDSVSKSFKQHLPEIFCSFTEFNDRLWDLTKFYDISQNWQNFLGIIFCFHSTVMYFVDFWFLLSVISKADRKILVSFWLIQIFKVSTLQILS